MTPFWLSMKTYVIIPLKVSHDSLLAFSEDNGDIVVLQQDYVGSNNVKQENMVNAKYGQTVSGELCMA